MGCRGEHSWAHSRSVWIQDVLYNNSGCYTVQLGAIWVAGTIRGRIRGQFVPQDVLYNNSGCYTVHLGAIWVAAGTIRGRIRGQFVPQDVLIPFGLDVAVAILTTHSCSSVGLS